MSHYLRKDKTCLNCGAIVEERYCPHCGQENTEPKDSFKHLLGHFLADVTHYDSQLFTTIKDLIIKPGFLTREYNAGRRASYLNPIRMYIFISALFFLVTCSQKKDENNTNAITTTKQDINLFRQHLADSLRGIRKSKKPLSPGDSVGNAVYSSLAARLDTPKTPTTGGESVAANISDNGAIVFRIQENKYANTMQYDAAQRKLPDSARDDATMRYVEKKIIRLMHEQGHKGEIVITRNIEHDLPKIMFILLPLFALFVGVFYSSRKFLYSQHVIFSLHFHSFLFIALLIAGLVSLALPMDKAWFILVGVWLFGVFIYLATALHTAYSEALWRSVIKAVGISVVYIIMLIAGVLLLFVVTFIFL